MISFGEVHRDLTEQWVFVVTVCGGLLFFIIYNRLVLYHEIIQELVSYAGPCLFYLFSVFFVVTE